MTTEPRGVVLFAHPSSDLYGSDRALLESLHALRSDGWRLIVALPSRGPLVPYVESLGAEVRIVSVPVLRKALLSPRGVAVLLVRSLLTLGRLIRLLQAARPSLVYVNTTVVPLWIIAAFLARRPTLCHVHEAEERAPFLLRLGLMAPLLLCRTVVVNSRATLTVVVRTLPRLRGRIDLIYNGVPGPGTPPEPLEQPMQRVRLVVVGRLAPRKGIDVAVAAADLLTRRGRNVELHLVGSIFPGYEWYEEQLRAAAAAPTLKGRVHLQGFRADVWSAYAMAHVVLVPSRAEPFGNVAVEAMLAGRPVVAARVQGLSEIVTDGRNGLLVSPEDPVELADAVASLVDNWQRAIALALAGQESARRRFGTARYAAEISSVAAAAAVGRL